MGDGVIHRSLETLADHRAHRASQKLKLERAGNDVEIVQLAGEHDERVLLTGGLLRLCQPILVALAIAELERIFRRDGSADFHELGVLVEKPFEPLARPDAHVMAALGAHVDIPFELRPIQHRIAGRTFDPQPFRHGARATLGLDSRGHDFLEPGHRRISVRF